MSDDKRTVSMPLATYKADLQAEHYAGRKDAMRRFLLIIEQVKADPRDAVCMVVEDYEDDQQSIDRMLKALGLFELAQEIWGSK